jgi:O-antigen/teichoic acid export membrane protein
MDAQERIERNTIISFFAGTGNRLLDAASGILFANVAGASALGIYYTFVSLYQLINRINNIGLGDAIIKQVSEYDRPDGDGGTEIIPNLIGAALAIRGVTVTVTSLGVILFRSQVDQYVGQDLAWVALLFVLGIFMLLGIIRTTLIGQKQIHLSSLLDVIRSISVIGTQIALVLLGWKEMGLIVGLVFGLGITLLNAVWIADIWRPAVPSRDRITSMVSFAKFSYIDGFLGGKHRWIDVLILGAFVEPGIIGIYGIVYSVSRFGLVFSNAIGLSVFPEVSSFESAANEQKQRSIIHLSMQYSTLLSIPLLLGAITLGDLVLQFIYSFDSGHQELMLLAVGMLFYSIHIPIRKSLYGLNAPDDAVRVSLVAVLVNVGLGVALAPEFGAIGVALSTTFSMIVGLTLGIYYLQTYLSDIFAFSRRPWFVQIGAGLMMTAIVLGTRQIIGGRSRVLTISLVVLGVIVYFLTIVIFDHRLRTRANSKLHQFDLLPL